MLGLLPIIAAGLGLERGQANELRSRLGVFQRKEPLPPALRAQVANVRAEQLQVVLQVFARDGLEITPGLRTTLFLAMVQVVQVGQVWRGRDSTRPSDWPSASLLLDYLARYPLVESQWSWPLLLEGLRRWEMETAEALAQVLQVQMVDPGQATPALQLLIRWLGRRIALGDPEPYPFLPTLADWWETERAGWTEAQLLNLGTGAMLDVAAEHAGVAAAPTDAWRAWSQRVSNWRAQGRRPLLGPVEMQFPGGWALVRLVDPPQFRDESEIMDHCVGRGSHFEGYFAKHTAGTHAYYSLRDTEGFPRVTFEIEKKDGAWSAFRQAYGPHNTLPDASLYPILTQIFARSMSLSPAFFQMVRPEYPAFERVLASFENVVAWCQHNLKRGRKASGLLLHRMDATMGAVNPSEARAVLNWAVAYAEAPTMGVFSVVAQVPDLTQRYLSHFALSMNNDDFLRGTRRSPIVAVQAIRAAVDRFSSYETPPGAVASLLDALLQYEEAWLEHPAVLAGAMSTGGFSSFYHDWKEGDGSDASLALDPFFSAVLGARRPDHRDLDVEGRVHALVPALVRLGEMARERMRRDPIAILFLWAFQPTMAWRVLGENPAVWLIRQRSAVVSLIVASRLLTSWDRGARLVPGRIASSQMLDPGAEAPSSEAVLLQVVGAALSSMVSDPVALPVTLAGSPVASLPHAVRVMLEGAPGVDGSEVTRAQVLASFWRELIFTHQDRSILRRDDRNVTELEPTLFPLLVTFVRRAWVEMGRAQDQGRLDETFGSPYSPPEVLGRTIGRIWGLQQAVLRQVRVDGPVLDAPSRKAMRKVLPRVASVPYEAPDAQWLAIVAVGQPAAGSPDGGHVLPSPSWEEDLIAALGSVACPSSALAQQILMSHLETRALSAAQRRILIRALATHQQRLTAAVDHAFVDPSEVATAAIRRRAGDTNQDISAALGLSSAACPDLASAGSLISSAAHGLRFSLSVLSATGQDLDRVKRVGPLIRRYTDRPDPLWMIGANWPAPPKPLQIAAQYDVREESLTDAQRAWPCFWLGVPHRLETSRGEALALSMESWSTLESSQAAAVVLREAFAGLSARWRTILQRRHGGDPFAPSLGLALFVGCTPLDVFAPHRSSFALRLLPSAAPLSLRVPMELPGGEQGWAILLPPGDNARTGVVIGRVGISALATPLRLH